MQGYKQSTSCIELTITNQKHHRYYPSRNIFSSGATMSRWNDTTVNCTGRQDEITRHDIKCVGNCSVLRPNAEHLRSFCGRGITLGNRSVIIGRPLGAGFCVPTRHAASNGQGEGMTRMVRSASKEHIECCTLGQELLSHVLGNYTDYLPKACRKRKFWHAGGISSVVLNEDRSSIEEKYPIYSSTDDQSSTV